MLLKFSVGHNYTIVSYPHNPSHRTNHEVQTDHSYDGMTYMTYFHMSYV